MRREAMTGRGREKGGRVGRYLESNGVPYTTLSFYKANEGAN